MINANGKENKFAVTQLGQPETILTHKQDIVPYSKDYSEIKKFHKSLAYEQATVQMQNKAFEQEFEKQEKLLFGLGNVMLNQN